MTIRSLRVLAVTGVVLLAACGSTTNLTVQESTTITKGQELTDLLRALNEGALTQREFEWLRDRIMRRPN